MNSDPKHAENCERDLWAGECPCNATTEQITEARGWIWDCWGKEFAYSLTDSQVVAGIQRHYAGGWAQFIADGQLS